MGKKIQQGEINDLFIKLNKKITKTMPYKIDLVNPKDLHIAKKNARFMKPETFNALVQNIKRDGNLSSIPFCFMDEKGAQHVLSGNHRVQAAVQAGINQILIFYATDLTKSEQIAIQLSHNAIEGQDDLAILKELWESINELDLKIYAGLDSDTLNELEKISFEGFSEERIDYKSVSFLFLPEEIERAKEVFDKINFLFGKEDVYIFSLKNWKRFFDLICEIKTNCNVKNSATAFMYLIDLAENKIKEMRPPVGGNPDDQSGEAVQIRPGRSKEKSIKKHDSG